MNSNSCIFATDRVKCQPNSSESFAGIICNEHLKCVYGLELQFFTFESQSERIMQGPYLRVADNWSFKTNTVLLPDKKFFDKRFKTFASENVQIDDYNYELNPKIVQYVLNLGKRDKNRISDLDDKRYHYEIIRNLCIYEPMNIDDFESSLNSFKTKVQDRLSKLRHLIYNSSNAKMFADKSIDITDNNGLTDMGADQTISAFYKFMLTNMFFSYHFMPNTEALITSLDPNVIYKKDIGFVVTRDIMSPSSLVVLGHEKGNLHQYSFRTAVVQKTPKEMAIPQSKDYPDSVHTFNALTGKYNSFSDNLSKDCVKLF